MRHTLLMPIIVLCAVSNGHAHHRRDLHLKDRLAEMDLVLVGSLEAARVAEIPNAPDARRFVAVGTIAVDEVIRGEVALAAGKVDVALARPTASRPLAEIQVDGIRADKDKVTWLLRRAEAHLPVSFYTVYRNKPDTQANMTPYTAAFRAEASKLRQWDAVRIEFSIPDEPMKLEQDATASVRIVTDGPGGRKLPSNMSWQGHLQVAIEEDKDGYMRDSVWDQFRHPRIAVIAARGRDGKSIPADLAAAGPLEATVTVRPLDIPIEGATRSYWCFVQLIDHRGVVLVQSAPKKIRITAAATQPTNPR